MAHNPEMIDQLALPDGGGLDAGGPQSAGAANLLIALRHHWKMVAILWPVFMALSVPPIWKLIKPEYTATARVRVDPVMSTVLDKQMQTMPLFDQYLASQVELMNSGEVLNKALSDTSVAGLAVLSSIEPVTELRKNLSISQPPKTQIIRIEVSDENRDAAKRLADAVMGAYMELYGGAKELNDKLEFLRKQSQDFQRELEDLKAKKLSLADEFKAMTPSMFEKLREVESKGTETVKANREAVQLRIWQIQQELDQVKADKYVPQDENPMRQQEAIENHPLVKSTREQLLTVSAQLVRLQAGGLSDEAPAVQELKQQMAALKQELDKQRKTATDEYTKDQLAIQANLKQSRITGMETRLKSEQAILASLDQKLEEMKKSDRSMGDISIQIETRQEAIEKVTKRLEEVEDAKKKLEVESKMPGRVSIASKAEVLPEGLKDKRKKMIPAAVAGSLFAALGLALVRSKFDARLYAPVQVESQTGLRILGAVPAISELKRGRVTEEEFAEAYRLVRVNLLSRTLGEPPRSILVTSAQSGEGKTSLAVSLAVSLAELSGRVLLIDGDIQAPQIAKLLGLKAPRKLREALSGTSLGECAVPSKLKNLDVLLGGKNGEGAREVFDQHTVEKLVREAVDKYQFVVVDSPPALGAADSLIWSQAVDSVVLSTFVGGSDIRATRHVCDRLGMVGARVLGAVVCNVSISEGFGAYPSYSYSFSRSKSYSRESDDPLYLPQMRLEEKPADGSEPEQKKSS